MLERKEGFGVASTIYSYFVCGGWQFDGGETRSIAEKPMKRTNKRKDEKIGGTG